MKNRPLIIFLGGFLFFCLDQIIKQLSLRVFTHKHLLFKIFGWNPFLNHGIAFGLPFPNILTIIFTIIILCILVFVLVKHTEIKNGNQIFIGLTLIFWGASSNLLDRLIYKNTIDYILIGTGIINLADIIITLGFIVYLLPHKFFKT